VIDYTSKAETASRLIKNAGTALTIKRDIAGVTDPITGITTGASIESYPVNGVKLRYKNTDIDGTLVKSGDLRVLLSVEGLTIVPESTDIIVVSGASWKIIDVKPLEPAETVVLYELQVRK